tara:strand:- start:78760 stop:79233 length:474 start_codon:yes stop_codon:yes gene_type:complete
MKYIKRIFENNEFEKDIEVVESLHLFTKNTLIKYLGDLDIVINASYLYDTRDGRITNNLTTEIYDELKEYIKGMGVKIEDCYIGTHLVILIRDNDERKLFYDTMDKFKNKDYSVEIQDNMNYNRNGFPYPYRIESNLKYNLKSVFSRMIKAVKKINK